MPRVYDRPMHASPKLIVVTAASSNHYGALRQMLESLAGSRRGWNVTTSA